MNFFTWILAVVMLVLGVLAFTLGLGMLLPERRSFGGAVVALAAAIACFVTLFFVFFIGEPSGR